jgi:hypothetical protein
MKNRWGWGDCSVCGINVSASKHGLAVRHGFIKVRRGTRRLAYPDVLGGRTAHACEGSGKPLLRWFKKTAP